MEAHVVFEMADLEKSTALDHHEAPRCTQLAHRHAAVRAQQSRIKTTILYQLDGAQCATHDKIGNEMRRKFVPAFRQRQASGDAMAVSLPHVQRSGLDVAWTWQHGELRSASLFPTRATSPLALPGSATAFGPPAQLVALMSPTTLRGLRSATLRYLRRCTPRGQCPSPRPGSLQIPTMCVVLPAP